MLYKNSKGKIITIIIDTEDVQRIIDFDMTWIPFWDKVMQQYYIKVAKYRGKENGKDKHEAIYLHRFLINAKGNEYVDHINHNTLDNRKENLRQIPQTNNATNRKGKNKNNKSGYRNVFWNSGLGKWQVSLCRNYRTIVIGYFDDVHEAGKVAGEARQKYYKNFKGEN
jgi:hypothetical protein